MPTGMHPWMDPRTAEVWTHSDSAIYRAFDRLFDCRRHGWANLQSMHINLPFADDDEFARLHAAVRLILPLIPALAASSPFADGRRMPFLDYRLEVYRTNAERVPAVTGAVIPDNARDRADYRSGVLDGRALYVCKYLMAPGHWQVIKREPGKNVEGATIPLTIGETPEIVVKTAVQAASVIGDGLYGVDLKQVGDRCYVIEVNDNPNIDAGNEDGVLKEALYREVLGVFLRRIRERGKPVEA